MNRAELRSVAAVVLAIAGMTAIALTVTAGFVRPFTVDGPSMEPTLFPGDRVLVDLRAFRDRPPSVGDVVLVRVPAGGTVVKRIAALPAAPDGERPVAWVLGDNAGASLDSRSFGAVPVDRIAGRVAFRYWPPSGFGAIE